MWMSSYESDLGVNHKCGKHKVMYLEAVISRNPIRFIKTKKDIGGYSFRRCFLFWGFGY